MGIRVLDVLSGKGLESGPSSLFMYFPYADFEIGSLRFVKGGQAFPERPRIGDRLLIFSSTQLGRDDMVVIPVGPLMFIETEDRLSTRSRTSEEEPSIEELTETIEALLERDRRRQRRIGSSLRASKQDEVICTSLLEGTIVPRRNFAWIGISAGDSDGDGTPDITDDTLQAGIDNWYQLSQCGQPGLKFPALQIGSGTHGPGTQYTRGGARHFASSCIMFQSNDVHSRAAVTAAINAVWWA